MSTAPAANRKRVRKMHEISVRGGSTLSNIITIYHLQNVYEHTVLFQSIKVIGACYYAGDGQYLNIFSSLNPRQMLISGEHVVAIMTAAWLSCLQHLNIWGQHPKLSFCWQLNCCSFIPRPSPAPFSWLHTWPPDGSKVTYVVKIMEREMAWERG